MTIPIPVQIVGCVFANYISKQANSSIDLDCSTTLLYFESKLSFEHHSNIIIFVAASNELFLVGTLQTISDSTLYPCYFSYEFVDIFTISNN